MLVALNAASLLLRFGGYVVKYITFVIASMRQWGQFGIHQRYSNYFAINLFTDNKFYRIKVRLNYALTKILKENP
jgi:hypothetical protein